MSFKNYDCKGIHYASGRPEYPEKMYKFLEKELGIKNKCLVDMGAGTGIFSKKLLENNNYVYLVEPNIEMLYLARKGLSSFKKKTLYNCCAENTPILSNSIDAVISAQSYHWFDNKKIKLEFQRILKNDGLVIIVWNELDYNDIISKEYKKLLEKYSDYNSDLDDIQLYRRQIELDFNKKVNSSVFDNYQCLNQKAFIDRILSSSFSPNKEQSQFTLFIEDAKKLFSNYSRQEEITMFLKTHLLYFTI